MTCWNGNVSQHFTRIHIHVHVNTCSLHIRLLFSLSCPVITLLSLWSLPRNHRISIYHMWAAASYEKNISHFLLFWGGPYCSTTLWPNSQWSAIFRLVGWLSSSSLALPSDRLCVLKQLCQLGASVQVTSWFKRLCHIDVSRAWQI